MSEKHLISVENLKYMVLGSISDLPIPLCCEFVLFYTFYIYEGMLFNRKKYCGTNIMKKSLCRQLP